jgi:hypothetical protein
MAENCPIINNRNKQIFPAIIFYKQKWSKSSAHSQYFHGKLSPQFNVRLVIGVHNHCIRKGGCHETRSQKSING